MGVETRFRLGEDANSYQRSHETDCLALSVQKNLHFVSLICTESPTEERGIDTAALREIRGGWGPLVKALEQSDAQSGAQNPVCHGLADLVKALGMGRAAAYILLWLGASVGSRGSPGR